MSKRTLWLLAASLGLALWVASVPLHAAQASPATGQGPDVCAVCHEETANAFKSTPHMASEKGCVGCHGDATAHIEGGGGKGTIRNPKTLSAKDASEICETCHTKGNQKHFTGSTHDSRNVSCITCHNPHPQGPVPNALLRKPQLELCTSCHLQKKGALMRSSHMPLREGKLTCTSCHNPHGTPYPRMLKQVSANQNCYSCHAEKRGPFLWEHAPVRESCMNCHDAHGTVNDFLLKAKMPLLCIQCHNGFAGGGMGNAHAARDRYTLNQSCMNCHLEIHGSMHPQGNRFKR